MGKYSENPIDNLQGYLGNIEMILERMEERQKELAAAPSQSADDSELESIKGELSSIRTAIDEIRKDNGLVSASMNTVAEAIGTVPTEEERTKLPSTVLVQLSVNKLLITPDNCLSPWTNSQLPLSSASVISLRRKRKRQQET